MEDLKKIQEFFSKPIKENSRLRKQFILLEPAEIKYTESFGTGIKAPGVLHQANEGVFLGAEDAYIIVLPGGTFYVDEDAETAMPIWPLKDQSQELHKVLSPTPFAPEFKVWKDWIKRPEVNEAKKLTYNDFVRMVRDDMNAGSSSDEHVSDEQVKKVAKRKYNEYLQGASVDDLFEYNTGIYYDPAKDNMRPKAKEASKSALERVKDMIKKIASEQKMGEALSDFEEEEANYDELYSDYKYKVDEAKPKKGHGEKISKEVFAKLKGKTINYKGHDYKVVDSDEAVLTLKDEDGKSKTINLRQFNVSGMIDEIMETIELGKTLEEKLCKKGEAYRKKRLAAGEKSSAYLNGRAVKVCKGQMKG